MVTLDHNLQRSHPLINIAVAAHNFFVKHAMYTDHTSISFLQAFMLVVVFCQYTHLPCWYVVCHRQSTTAVLHIQCECMKCFSLRCVKWTVLYMKSQREAVVKNKQGVLLVAITACCLSESGSFYLPVSSQL